VNRRGAFIRIDGGGPDFSLETLLLRFAISALGLLVAAAVVPGLVIGDWQSLLAGAAIFGIVNMLLRPLAYFVSCCLIVATFGLFALVVNALLLALTAWTAGRLGLNFEVHGFWPAFFGALIISLVSLLASIFVRRRPRRA
jgi:putative membrane protein